MFNAVEESAMREVRTFEIEYGEPAAHLRVARPLVVEVEFGRLWLTIEGDAEDYMLDAGQTMKLPRGARAWVGAEGGDARLSVAMALERARSTGAGAAQRRPGSAARRLHAA
jgi:quercetin dioxygenase-like cupin family protein